VIPARTHAASAISPARDSLGFRAPNRFGSCSIPWAEKRRQSRLGDDFGRHTRGGRGDCDSRIGIPPGRQGDDLKILLGDG